MWLQHIFSVSLYWKKFIGGDFVVCWMHTTRVNTVNPFTTIILAHSAKKINLTQKRMLY